MIACETAAIEEMPISSNMKYVVLGGGSVTAEFYLPALSLMGLADKTIVVDPREDSLAPLRGLFPGVTFLAQDHRNFLANLPAVGEERVIIALPNALHVETVEMALAAGRHVLVRKAPGAEIGRLRPLGSLGIRSWPRVEGCDVAPLSGGADGGAAGRDGRGTGRDPGNRS